MLIRFFMKKLEVLIDSNYGRDYTQTTSRVGFLRRCQPTNLKPACIAQPIQVELLQQRLSLVQIRGGSLQNSQLLKLFVYNCP